MVFALDAATGAELWRWDPAIPTEEQGGPRTCCGDVNRGAALHGDKVILGLLDGRLVALDRADGSLVWATQTTPPGSDYTVTGAPRVMGDIVVIGNAGAEYGVRGYVTAYDVETGERRWRTHTVRGEAAGPRPERPPLKGPSNLLLAWDPAENREVWRVPAEGRHGGTLSTAGGLVFWGTGSRLVALDAQTGRELWEAELDGSPGSPVTYSAGGRQYVAIGSGQASGRRLPRMWAFALPEGAR